jgi:hypothetical protein
MPRRTGPGAGAGQNIPTPGIPASSWSKVWGLGLMLLLLVAFLFLFRGRVPRAVERSFAATPPDPAVIEDRHREVAAMQGGAWYDAPDGADFAETPGYRRLLGLMIDHAPSGDVVEKPPPFDYELALRTPDLQRANVVRVRGYVAKTWAQKLEQPVFQMTDVWRVVVTEGPGENGMVVDVIDRPPALETERDLVELDARFYRLLRYVNPQGKKVELPYLLARSLKVVPEEARPTLGASLADPANIVLLIAIAGIVAFATVRVIKSRRRPTVRWRAPHLHSSSVPHSPEG